MCLAFSQADQLDGKLEFSRAATALWSRREPKSGADGEGVGLGVGVVGGVGGARAGVGVGGSDRVSTDHCCQAA